MNKKISKLGKPSLVFGWGQKKRLNLVKKYIDLKAKRVLDVGCGIGVYSKKFFEEGAIVWGIDIDKERIQKAKRFSSGVNFLVAKTEELPFENDFFDFAFLNEVLEHVEDDKKTISEVLRVLRPEGKMIIFVPNRLFPFETHGVFVGKKYIFGNIPFVNWLPLRIRDLFCPHVRIYTVKSLKKLFANQKVDFEVISYVFPAFDKIKKRFPVIGKILKKFAHSGEGNFILKKFGISIFMIIKKTNS